MNGKGSKRRPGSVSQNQFAYNWERAFGRDPVKEILKTQEDLWGAVGTGGKDMSKCSTVTENGVVSIYFEGVLFGVMPLSAYESFLNRSIEKKTKHHVPMCDAKGCKTPAKVDDRGFVLVGQPYFAAYCLEHRGK